MEVGAGPRDCGLSWSVHLFLRDVHRVLVIYFDRSIVSQFMACFWLLQRGKRERENVVVSSIFFPFRVGVKDGCTLSLGFVHQLHKSGNVAARERELLKYESLTPNLQFISVKIQSQLHFSLLPLLTGRRGTNTDSSRSQRESIFAGHTGKFIPLHHKSIILCTIALLYIRRRSFSVLCFGLLGNIIHKKSFDSVCCWFFILKHFSYFFHSRLGSPVRLVPARII